METVFGDRELLVLTAVGNYPGSTQRVLSKLTGLALGGVNSIACELKVKGYLFQGGASGGRRPEFSDKAGGGGIDSEKRKFGASNSGCYLTAAGMDAVKPYEVRKAVILAAGFGTRFVPLAYDKPKGLLEVFGEPMVEREIRQLKEAGVGEIRIVVGYKREQFEYLTGKYGVELIYNPEYDVKNNIASLNAAADFLKGSNAYILSSDHWMRENVFHRYEARAWYASAFSKGDTREWKLVTDKKGRIIDTYPGGRNCDYMYGPAYFSEDFSAKFLPVLRKYCEMPGTEEFFWEHVLMGMLNGEAKKRLRNYFGKIPELECCEDIKMYINRQPDGNIYEMESLEELREFDEKYKIDSGSEIMRLVSGVFGVPESDVVNIRMLKKGMTNRSWLFQIAGTTYVFRVPGEGTEKLVNRHEEKAVFDAVKDLGISEEIMYFDEDTGYKISKYYEGARNADFNNISDTMACMKLLRSLHESGRSVGHDFNIEKKINYYESLVGDVSFEDYETQKAVKEKLLGWLSSNSTGRTLCHIDSVEDNFIFIPGGGVKLIDWEYASMCDPMIDLGMCAIYSYMDEGGAEKLMECYFGRPALDEERRLVYAYMAAGGLLWSLWGLYKEMQGIDFSDYTNKMYRYFKSYSAKVLNT